MRETISLLILFNADNINNFLFFLERVPSTRNMMNLKKYSDQRVPADQPVELASMMTVPTTAMTKPAIQNLQDQAQHRVFPTKNLQCYHAELTEWNIL